VETSVRAGQRSPTTGARHLLAAHGATASDEPDENGGH
jgi:hypothetical protein